MHPVAGSSFNTGGGEMSSDSSFSGSHFEQLHGGGRYVQHLSNDTLELQTSAATIQSRRMVLEYTSALVAQAQANFSALSHTEPHSPTPMGSTFCSAPSTRSGTPSSLGSMSGDESEDQFNLESSPRPVRRTIVKSSSDSALNELPGDEEDFDFTREDSATTVEDESTLPPPPPKPRRPLSAYNLFFKYERARLLIFSEEGKNSLSEAPPAPKLTAPEIRSLLDNNPYHVDRDKRRHRKSHGRVSFRELTVIILKNWKALNEESRAAFEEMGAEHKAKYDTEAADYKAWKAKEQKIRARRKRKVARARVLKSGTPDAATDHFEAKDSGRKVRRRLSCPGALSIGPAQGAVDGSSSKGVMDNAKDENPKPDAHCASREIAYSKPSRDGVNPIVAFSELKVNQPNRPRRSEVDGKDVLNFLRECDWDLA
eukprot:CAMPEP_0197440588 /NCGR_PEP_ID=MMETSP1175-20131217/7050_1 /TAXON_ID=1003142 /ORGANISM="Triceratium dubium, Strain CCMP147" /LENGTH=426 /DNA_ID=CAMNT_0042970723 /DNA_START=35 /DNA_END=1315 /DNA_ORIENTATION=+